MGRFCQKYFLFCIKNGTIKTPSLKREGNGNDRKPLIPAKESSGTVTSRAGGYAVRLAPHHIRLRKEKSDPSDATKVWLARFFGVSVDYLMGLSDERYPGYAAASSDVLLLPEGLTEEQRSAVQDYALFLAERNG